VLMSVPAVDFQLHNSLFLVAHFHNMVIGGVLFGYFCGLAYWFPKIFGFGLHEKLGKAAFWLWIVGFAVAFIPLYVLGLMGMTRRLDFVDASTGYHPLLIVAAVGACIIALGVATQLFGILVSVLQRKQRLDTSGDYWNGRTLEWSTASPAPLYNFAYIPEVQGRDAFWMMKEEKHAAHENKHGAHATYEDIALPKNSMIGLVIATFAFLFGFGTVWHMWWLLPVALVGIFATVLIRSFAEETEYILPASVVQATEADRMHV
jgi:cytochrome o ubiquinol oxidase subunit 1